jgi:hypothetical protein
MNESAEPYSESQRVVHRGEGLGSIAGDSETETSSELGNHGTNDGPELDAVEEVGSMNCIVVSKVCGTHHLEQNTPPRRTPSKRKRDDTDEEQGVLNKRLIPFPITNTDLGESQPLHTSRKRASQAE